MIPRPTSSRTRLDWSVFETTDDGNKQLVLPLFYADLFEHQLPYLVYKSNTGFRISKTGKTKYAFFIDLTEDEMYEIEAFIEDFSHYIVIGLNKNIKNFFKDELDFCIALNYNFQDGKRTSVGELEYIAKWDNTTDTKKKNDSIKQLKSHMENAFQRTIYGIDIKNLCVTCPPFSKDKDFYLPKILSESICANCLNDMSKSIFPTIAGEKPSTKDMSFPKKVAFWRDFYERNCGKMKDQINGKDIVIIDDLYQSGTTIWSFAQFLKSVGATSVIGLVSVKSLKDTDNL